MWGPHCPWRARFAVFSTLAFALILPLQSACLKLDQMATQVDFVRCKVQHCTPTWDPIIATSISQEHVFANPCELGCYFQVTGVEEETVELNLAVLTDDTLRPNAACLRAWKHALFNDWASLDPTLTEKDPLPLWLTSLYTTPEMDANEAETVLSWCLGEEQPSFPMKQQISGRRILASNTASDIDTITSNGATTAVVSSSSNENRDSTKVNKMEQFSGTNPSLIVTIDSNQIPSSESSINNDSLISITPNEGIAVSDQPQQGIDDGNTVSNPPIISNTTIKPKPSPQPELEQPEDQNNNSSAGTPDSANPPSTDGSDNNPTAPSPDTNSDPNTDNTTPDNNNNNTNYNDYDYQGDGSDVIDTTNDTTSDPTPSDSSSPPVDDNSESTNTDTAGGNEGNGDGESSSGQQDSGGDGNGGNDSGTAEGGQQEEVNTISLEDLAIPGDYKPIIITPESGVDLESLAGADGGEDPGHLLQAGSYADGSTTAGDVSGATPADGVSGDTAALAQLAMSQTSSAFASTRSMPVAVLVAAAAASLWL